MEHIATLHIEKLPVTVMRLLGRNASYKSEYDRTVAWRILE
jgi:hypothetical protein